MVHSHSLNSRNIHVLTWRSKISCVKSLQKQNLFVIFLLQLYEHFQAGHVKPVIFNLHIVFLRIFQLKIKVVHNLRNDCNLSPAMRVTIYNHKAIMDNFWRAVSYSNLPEIRCRRQAWRIRVRRRGLPLQQWSQTPKLSTNTSLCKPTSPLGLLSSFQKTWK